MMGASENKSERHKLNVDVIRKGLLEVLSGLESKERQLNAIQESLAQSSKELDGMRESIEARLREVEDKEKDFHFFQSSSFKDLELKKEELSLIREDVMVRQEKLKEQEKRIEGLFEEIKKEGKQFETTQKLIDEKFVEICLKEKQVNLIKKQIDSRANELHEREQSLDRRQKEIELREVFLASKNERKAKENSLDAREKILDFKKELDAIKTSKGLRQKSRKRLMNSVGKYKEISDADCSNPSKRSCHVKVSSNCAVEGGNSAHSHSDSGDASGSDEMEDNHVSPGPSSRAPANNAEQILVNEVAERDSYLGDNSVSNAIDYSNSLINDFQKQRSMGCFKSGQIWACYESPFCSNRRLPRLYVRIMEVLNHNSCFKLRTVYLQPAEYADREGRQKHKDWMAWIEAGLPVGCGTFKRANHLIKYVPEFSHQMCSENEFYPLFIYPRKGEIWALYKDCNIATWASDPVKHQNCKYEIVEILHKDDSTGSTTVACLDKMAGFVSLFQRRSQNEDDSFAISRSKIFRFSHKVPSLKMTGDKRRGVAEGSFQLDPKALPADS